MSETGDAANLPTQGRPPTLVEIRRSMRAIAFSYGITWGAATITTVLVLVAANTGSTQDDTGVDSNDTNGFGVILGMPFQFVAMALLGSLHLSENGIGVSIFFPPLALTAVYALAVYRLSATSLSVPDRGTRVMLAAISGLLASTAITLLTWVLAMRSDGVSVHAASVSLFFGAWALTSTGSYLGMTRTVGFTLPSWIPADYLAAFRMWCLSVTLWLVFAIPVLMTVAVFNQGLWVAILAPIWGVTIGLDSYALGHLGGLSFATETVHPWDLSTAWTIVVILGAIALTVITSVAWHLRRDRAPETLAKPSSWAILPATFAAGGLLVWLVPSIVLGGGFGTVGGSVTLQPAFWIVFVLAIWGGAAELVTRVVAPGLVGSLPARALRLVQGPPATVSGEPRTNASTPEVVARPMTSEERARLRRIVIAGGAVIGLGAAAWITISVLNAQAFGPEKQTKKYLDALVAGRAEEAVAMAPVSEDAGDALLSDEIYRAAGNRMTGYDIKAVKKDGDRATVMVRLKGLASSSTVALTLKKDGKSHGLFDDWKVTEGGLARDVSLSLPDSSTSLSVNDVAAASVGDDEWLLPGDYTFNPFGDNKWVEAAADPITVSPDEEYVSVDPPQVGPSEEFENQLQSALTEYLGKCMAAKTLEPAGCPNSAYDSDARKVVWSLDTAPTVDLSYFDGTFPMDLSSGEAGRATVTYEIDESYGFGAPDWQSQKDESSLYVNGTVDLSGDQLVFDFSGY